MSSNYNPEARSVFLSIMFRSTYHALTGYFLALVLERFIMFAAAVPYGYSLQLDYQYLNYRVDPSVWDQEAVLTIYLLPNFSFAIAIVWLHIKYSLKEVANPGFKLIFIYWLMFFFAYRVIGIMPVHIYFGTGIYHAFRWLYIRNLYQGMVGLVSIALFFMAASWLLNRITIIYCRMNDNLGLIGLPLLLLASTALPVAFCVGLAFLFFLPGLPVEEIFGLMFIIFPVIFTFLRWIFSDRSFSYSKYEIEEIFYQWQILIVVLLLVIITRILFGLKVFAI